MITAAIAACHAFRKNSDFSPTILYLGALIADYEIARLVLL